MTRPPGHTCPAIDSAQRVMRQIAWRAHNPDRTARKDAQVLLEEGLALLEDVRSENAQMRKAYYDMRAELANYKEKP